MNLLNATDMNVAAKTVASSLLPSTHKHPADLRTDAASSGAAGASSGAGSTITSKDFLTLLVTEMKNQDPTQPTDPNAYIQQLVGVNSLQQLIAINQDLTGSTGPGALKTGVSAPAVGSLTAS